MLPLLEKWAPVQDAAKPLKSLGFAFVRRLGRDTSILALTVNAEAHAVKEQPKEKAKGKGKVKKLPKQQKVECNGCDACYDQDWEFKVKTVAKLWRMLCECFSSLQTCSIIFCTSDMFSIMRRMPSSAYLQ